MDSKKAINKKIDFFNFSPDRINVINILPLGRSSSIFFQGLLDSHPEIINLPYDQKIYDKKIIKLNSKDIADKLYSDLLKNFSNYYSGIELDLNEKKFKDNILEYLDKYKISHKTILISQYFAYAKTKNLNLKKIKYIVCPAHMTNKDFFFLMKNFKKNLKNIYMFRDPRGTFVFEKKYLALSWITYLYGILNYNLIKHTSNSILIRHEDLHLQYPKVKKKIISFLDIKNNKSLNESSFFSLPYTGEHTQWKSVTGEISNKPNKKFVNEKWKTKLSSIEINIIQKTSNKILKENFYEICSKEEIKTLKIEKIKKEYNLRYVIGKSYWLIENMYYYFKIKRFKFN